jgi:hypothetical protein
VYRVMQGTFQRRDRVAPTGETLGVDVDLLTHQKTSKRVRDVAVGHGGGPGPAVPAAPGGAGPGPAVPAAPGGAGADPAAAGPQMKTVIVYPPLQKFSIEQVDYLIVNEDIQVQGFNLSGYWLVPYVIENDAAGLPKGRPEHVTEELHSNMKSADWGIAFQDMDPEPDRNYARLHVDFEIATRVQKIGFNYLKSRLDHAEEMEYNFALRMQGLLNCGLNAVWTCTEFGFDNTDRSYIMEQFLQKYIGRFLSQVSQQQQDMDPDKIVKEALQMHSRFSAGWTKEHKRGLSPTLDSCSEALVGHYCDGPLKFLVQGGMSRKEIARFLRRDEVLSPQFALCLNFFMVKMDQDRNGRNANYKSMFNATTSQLLQMKTLEDFLRRNVAYMNQKMEREFQTKIARRFASMTMDWYYIVSQLHPPTVQYTGVKRGKTRMSRSNPGLFFHMSS